MSKRLLIERSYVLLRQLLLERRQRRERQQLRWVLRWRSDWFVLMGLPERIETLVGHWEVWKRECVGETGTLKSRVFDESALIADNVGLTVPSTH